MAPASSKLTSFFVSLSTSETFTVFVIAIVSVPLLRLVSKIWHTSSSPLRVLRGPKPKGLGLFGNLKEIRSLDYGIWHEQAIEAHGPVMAYKGFMGSYKLLITDPKAVGHVLNNPTIYNRENVFQWIFDSISAEGVLSVNGAAHKRQRRVMNPSFSSAHVREMTETFVQISHQLREVLLSKLSSTNSVDSAEPTATVDMVDYLGRATLDIIGLAGFNYSFDSVGNRVSELSTSFSTLVRFARDVRFSADLVIVLMLKGMFPILRGINLDKRSKDMAEALKKIELVSVQVVDAAKRSLGLDKKESLTVEEEIKIGRSRDLLTSIMRANARTLEDNIRGLSDAEFAHQIPTFLFAGHETTASATVWTLCSLAAHPMIQTKLRNEILSLDVEYPTMDQLHALPYLEQVVRESLRYHSIVPFAERVAIQDDIIPVQEPYMDRYGKFRDHIVIRKGDPVQIPLVTINHSKAVWGDDAKVFNPDRWQSLPKAASSVPGVWGNQMSFGGGTRACIGFKFALTEMKVLLHTLVKAFEFELAVPLDELDMALKNVRKPGLKSDPQNDQLPIIIKRAPTEIVLLD